MAYTGPYSNFHEINLNLFMRALKKLKGGLGGESLVKKSNTEYDYEWKQLTAADVGAMPENYTAPVNSVNGKTGAVVVDAGDIGYNDAESYNSNTVGAGLNDLKSAISVLNTITGINLFNEDEAVSGYLATNGSITQYGDWKTTGYIPVYGLETIAVSSKSTASGKRNFNPIYFLHSYDANKSHIAKVWDSSTNGIYTVADGVYYIRFSYHDYASFNGVDLMVENGAIFHPYRPYEEYNVINSAAYFEQPQYVTDVTKKNIVCWGDSLTYSQYSEDIQYPTKLSELISDENTVLNFGVPGEQTIDIASRQGAIGLTLDPFTLPASGAVTVTIRNSLGLQSTSLMHNSLREGQLLMPADSNVANSVSVGVGYTNGAYKVSTVGTNPSSIIFDRPTVLNMYGIYYRNYIPIVWAGTNDAPSTSDDAQNIATIIKSMIDYSNRDEYLVLGLTHKPYADVVNTLLARTFGRHYVDVKEYLIQYGLDDNNLTATSQDETDIANSVVPTSLRYGTIHFNDYGYNAVANCVYQHGKGLGYWN